jgi:hypothetical protein
MSPRRRDDARSRQLRSQVAEEAARLLMEGGADSPEVARRKAAARFDLRDDAYLPTGDDIRDTLQGRQRLFQPAPGPGLRRLREAALEAMGFFSAFDPRLAGPVLEGGIGPDVTITLHLHADDPDALARLLQDQRIPARQRSRRLRLGRGQDTEVPAWRFEADGLGFELLLLPLSALRQAPLDALDDRAMARASAAAVKRLLDDPSG